MNWLSTLIFLGGAVHLSILAASALVPQVLDWRKSLAGLPQLTRQLIWVHGAFIVFVILGFGLVSVLLPGELAAGRPTARAFCFLVSFFWLARLAVQFTVFDATPYLVNRWLRIGYHSLTLAFCYLAAVYGWSAIWGWSP